LRSWHDDADDLDSFPHSTSNIMTGLSTSLSTSFESTGWEEFENGGYWDVLKMWLPPFGIFGAHHFYTGRTRWGILYVLTAGLCGCGWLSDFFRLEFFLTQARKRKEAELGVVLGSHYQIECDATRQRYDLLSTYQLWFPLGIFGTHHFYLGNNKLGCLYLCTLGGCGILWIIDLFRIPRLVAESNQGIDNLLKHLSQHKRNFNAEVHSLEDHPPPYAFPYQNGLSNRKSGNGNGNDNNNNNGNGNGNGNGSKGRNVENEYYYYANYGAIDTSNNHLQQTDIYSTSNPRSQYLDTDNGGINMSINEARHSVDHNKQSGSTYGQSYHPSYNIMYSPTDYSLVSLHNHSNNSTGDDHGNGNGNGNGNNNSNGNGNGNGNSNGNGNGNSNGNSNDNGNGGRKSQSKTQISAQLGYIPGILSWLNGTEPQFEDHNHNNHNHNHNGNGIGSGSSHRKESNDHNKSSKGNSYRKTLMNYGFITDEHAHKAF
jgi:TM2 domain-containing membrane protein YozV